MRTVSRPWALTAILAVSCLSLSGSADAAEPAQVSTSSTPASGERIDEIKVTGHYEESVGTSDAASQGTINKQLVDERPILRPGEVLELVPGLIITQHSGAGKANQYYLRGFNLDHGTDFATTLDGVPLNLRTHAHGQGYTDLNFLIPELIGRVDYFKGPYYAAHGDFASAGGADIHLADTLPDNRLFATVGVEGYLRGVVVGSPELMGGRLLYGIELFHNDGPWVRPDDYKRVSAMLRYTHPLGDGTWSISALAYHGTWDATDQIPLRAVQDGQLDRFGGVDTTTGGKSNRYSLALGWQQPLAGGRLEANVYAVRYTLNLFSDFTYFLDDPVNGDQFEQSDQRWLHGTSGKWTRTGDLDGHETTFSAGWEARVDRLKPIGLYHTVGRQRLATIRQDDVTETSGALYAEASLALTPWLRTLAGVRYDQFLFDVTSDRAANSGSGSAGIASPKLSVIAGPWAKTELFANAGLGFHSNDARGVTTTVDPSSGEKVDPVTPLVRTKGLEAGVRTELVVGVSSSVSLWLLDLDSELLFTGDAGTTEPSRPSRRTGVEWSTRWTPLRWLLFDLDVALSRARFTQDDPVGNFIPGSIETAVSGGVTLHQLGGFSASVFLRYFGPRPLIEDNSIRSSGSAVVNAQVTYKINDHFSVAGDVFNLFNARVDDIAYFYTSRLKGEPAAGIDDVHFHPAEKLSARVSLTAGY
jgi:outer membrane receptor protein involved in Fe transport